MGKEEEEPAVLDPNANMSLLDRKLADVSKGIGAASFICGGFTISYLNCIWIEGPTDLEKQVREETRILEEFKESVPLLSAAERAQGITYTGKPSW